MKEKIQQTKPHLENFLNQIWSLIIFIFLAVVVGLLFSPSKAAPADASFSERVLIRLSQPVNIIIGVSCLTFFLLSFVNGIRFYFSRLKKDPPFIQLTFERSLKTCLVGFFVVLVMWVITNVDLLLPKKEIHRFPEGATYEAEPSPSSF